jgi:hypothetical protein
LIMAMRIASALGKSLSLLRLASSGSLRSRGVMIRSSASPLREHLIPSMRVLRGGNTSVNK